MADIDCLRQTSGAGRVDEKRAIRDRHDRTLRRAQPRARKSLDCGIHVVAIATMRPYLWRAREGSDGRAKLFEQVMVDDRMSWRDDLDGMGEGRTAQVRVDERDDNPDARQAEPDRHIFGPIWHHQAYAIALNEPLIERPARETVCSLGERAVCEAFARREQCLRRTSRFRQLLNDVRQKTPRIGADRGCRLERAQPIFAC